MSSTRGKLDYRNEANEVCSRFKTEKILWKKERLQTIKLLLETEHSYKEVADIVGRHPSRVKVWAKLFREGGISSLLVRGNGGGRKPLMSKEIQEQLTEKLRDGSFRTAKQVETWLEKEFNLRYGKSSIYYVLGKLGGRLKVPRPSHTKKEKAKVIEFKQTLAEKIQALDLPDHKKVRLWVYDEMRYGLHPLLRKMWSLRGSRVVSPVNRRFEWGYLFGALEVESGQSEFLYTERVVKDFDRAFLEQISKHDSEAIHVVIGDGAGFHHREGVEQEEPLPENLRVLTLPPYSPELNPVEKLWDIVKDRICNVCWDTLQDIEDEITKCLRTWWEKAEGFSSLFVNSYLRSELNAIWK